MWCGVARCGVVWCAGTYADRIRPYPTRSDWRVFGFPKWVFNRIRPDLFGGFLGGSCNCFSTHSVALSIRCLAPEKWWTSPFRPVMHDFGFSVWLWAIFFARSSPQRRPKTAQNGLKTAQKRPKTTGSNWGSEFDMVGVCLPSNTSC